MKKHKRRHNLYSRNLQKWLVECLYWMPTECAVKNWNDCECKNCLRHRPRRKGK